jgi:hypothetical protein
VVGRIDAQHVPGDRVRERFGRLAHGRRQRRHQRLGDRTFAQARVVGDGGFAAWVVAEKAA